MRTFEEINADIEKGAGRSAAELQPLIGFFLNTLLLRTPVEPDVFLTRSLALSWADESSSSPTVRMSVLVTTTAASIPPTAAATRPASIPASAPRVVARFEVPRYALALKSRSRIHRDSPQPPAVPAASA